MNDTNTLSLRKTERQAFASSFRHGLWDILIGYIALEFALLPFLNMVVLPLWIVMVVVILWVHARVVRPRLGIAHFGGFRMRRITRWTWVMFALGVVALVALGFLSRMPSLGVYGGQVRLGLCFLMPLCLTAWALNLPRWYVYGLMLGVAPSVGEWLYQNAGVPHHGIVLSFGVCAAVIFTIGAVLFIRVLRLPLAEPDQDQRDQAH